MKERYEDIVTDPYMVQERHASGDIDDNSKLVAFLYLLARDHLPSGAVEQLVIDAQVQPSMYTNGWLAQWAQNRAKKLT